MNSLSRSEVCPCLPSLELLHRVICCLCCGSTTTGDVVQAVPQHGPFWRHCSALRAGITKMRGRQMEIKIISEVTPSSSYLPSFLYLLYPALRIKTWHKPFHILSFFPKKGNYLWSLYHPWEEAVPRPLKREFRWLITWQDSETTQGSMTSWKVTGCSWAFLNRSETQRRELGWLNTGLGFFRGQKGTFLYIFHFFWFHCL